MQHIPAEGPISLQVDRPQEGNCWPSHCLPSAGLTHWPLWGAAECCTHLLGGGGFSALNMAKANANILALLGLITHHAWGLAPDLHSHTYPSYLFLGTS